MGDSPVKKDVELSLKYGALLPGIGLQRLLSGSVTGTGSGRFQLRVKRYMVKGKWRTITPCSVWIENNVVTSRAYVDPIEQLELAI